MEHHALTEAQYEAWRHRLLEHVLAALGEYDAWVLHDDGTIRVRHEGSDALVDITFNAP